MSWNLEALIAGHGAGKVGMAPVTENSGETEGEHGGVTLQA